MNYPILYQWQEEVTNHLPCLNSWQSANVALFSLGVMRAEHCQQTRVARQVACGERVASAARRWRRFLDNQRFPLSAFFTHWTRWVLGVLPVSKIFLLVDETKLQDRLGALVVGVAWEGRCIPLAWRCYVANDADAYPAEGQVGAIAQLLDAVRAGVPDDRPVVVLADRGIGTSPALCRAVTDRDWYFLFRVTSQCKVCTPAGDVTISQSVSPGQTWAAYGRVFKQRGQVPAWALALWEDDHEQPWALVTNDPSLTGFEYACRNWQEQSFRDLKSGGWHWGHSRVRHPDHLARLLVLLVLAYAWGLALGGAAVRQRRAQPLHRRPDGTRRRQWSLFKEGLQFFVEVIQRHGHFVPLRFLPDDRFT